MHSALYFVYHFENKDKIVAVNVDVPLFIIQVLPPEYPDMVCETGLPVVGKMVISSPPFNTLTLPVTSTDELETDVRDPLVIV
ncbi:hypothetical protein OFI45_001863 [Escherichia coli]|nr:hypothetical protein [Escherichia coli]